MLLKRKNEFNEIKINNNDYIIMNKNYNSNKNKY